MRKTIISLFAAAFMLGGLAVACGDDDNCGEMPTGVTCQQANGTCTAMTCVDSDWQCSADATEVANVPANCSN